MCPGTSARLVAGTSVLGYLCVALTGCLSELGGEPPVGQFPDWLEPCEPPAGVEGPQLCGNYSVFEDRRAGAGRRLDLRVVVLPATGRRLAEPVLYLDGGPGAAATEAVAEIAPLLEPLRSKRDLLFVDQRGTGGAGALRCPQPALDGPLQAFFEELLPAQYVSDCRDRLASVADVRLYGTALAVDDFDEIRQALGYDQLILFGISYGTRAGLVYLRRHPESVRAAALKGVAPVDMRNPLPFARALDDTVGAVLAACAADRACRASHPDPHGDWARVRAAFEEGAVNVRATHPRTGERELVRVSRGVFADGLRHLLYHSAGAAELPGLLHAAALGDFTPFVRRELGQRMSFDALLADGVFLTVTCGEDLRFVTEEDVARETAGTLLGDYRIRRQLAACAEWPSSAAPSEDILAPVRADLPVLLLSGALDPATPAAGAERAARDLPQSRHVVVPNTAHGFAPGGCERRILVEFLRDASLDGLDASCVSGTRLLPFETAAPSER